MIAFIRKYLHKIKSKFKEKETVTVKCYGSDNTLLTEMQLSKKQLESLNKKLELWKKRDLAVKAFWEKERIKKNENKVEIL
jgi:hypothetical protein